MIDAFVAQCVEMRLGAHEGAPFVQRERGKPVAQGDVHQALFHDARTVWKGDGVAELDENIVIVVLNAREEFFKELHLFGCAVDLSEE